MENTLTLKKAFQYQNVLQRLIQSIGGMITDSRYMTEVVQDHYREKSNPSATNEMGVVVDRRNYKVDGNQLLALYISLLEEKESLTMAIGANESMNAYNALLEKNKIIRGVIGSLSIALSYGKTVERAVPGQGRLINVEGNQSSYEYEIIEHVTPSFNTSFLRSYYQQKLKEAEKNSEDIEFLQTSLKINFDPRWNTCIELEDILNELANN